jgi:UDP-glucose 4-epimerase
MTGNCAGEPRIELTNVTAFVTGCAGFIGSSLTDRLLASGCKVVGIDNFSTGQWRFLAGASQNPNFRLVEADLLDVEALTAAMQGANCVFHLAANADVRLGIEQPRKDLEQNTIATHNVLESMRANGIGKIAFASTGSVYGEAKVFPTPEDAPFPVQTSLYGASKLACEGLINAYCEGFGFQSWIFRFVSILGERYTHGHVFDFYCALQRDPSRLRVLGDGRQEKSYLYVQDCVDAILTAAEHHRGEPGAHVYNLGTDETIVVDESVAIITEHLGLSPEIEHTGGRRGWIGDSPLIHLDTKRIRSLGWEPRLTIPQAVARTLEWFAGNEYAWRDLVAKGSADE